VVALQLHVIFALDTLGAFILIQAFAGEDLHIDDDAFHAGRHREGRILDVPGLLTENCAQQLLFRRQLSLTLRSHLPDENVARLDFGADPDNSALIKIPKRFFADIRNVAGNIFLTQLGVAGFDFKLLNMNGGEGIFPHQLFTQQESRLRSCTRPTA
jgi:hypothetical protein